jgi:protein-S-isoprenylcysteine O-methyltransferase Ste14
MATPHETSAPESAGAARGVAAKAAAAWVSLPLFFLATGGSLVWWEAWVYSAVLLVPMTVFLIHMTRHDPQFLARRLEVREKQRTQRRIQAWGSLAFLAALVVPGIDHRFGWSNPPRVVVVAAMAIVLVSYLTVLRVFLENRWAGRTVETYAEQHVISTGPYAIVRHPMYAGSTALYLATPVALGSWWALLPVLTLVPIFVLRIRNEEEVLLRELSGYEEYRRKVRYRLVPFIW